MRLEHVHAYLFFDLILSTEYVGVVLLKSSHSCEASQRSYTAAEMCKGMSVSVRVCGCVCMHVLVCVCGGQREGVDRKKRVQCRTVLQYVTSHDNTM